MIYLGSDFNLYNKQVIVKDDLMTYVCRPCKKKYDAQTLGANICPRCGKTMKYAKERWTHVKKL